MDGGFHAPTHPSATILWPRVFYFNFRSHEDELELDEYNPEDELDDLLLKPEDILGEEFSLTSGIEGKFQTAALILLYVH